MTRSTLRIAITLLVVSTAWALLSKALDFGGAANLAGLLACMFLVSLSDRERFYGEPHPFRRRSRR